MRRSFFRRLFGEVDFSADQSDGARLLNLFMEYGIVYRDFSADDSGRLGFTCSSYSALMIQRLCKQKGIEIQKTGSRGIPPMIYRYKKRVGILIGAVIAAFLLAVYDDYVWDITVSGNESVTYSEVVAALEAHGFGVGTPLLGLNVDRIKTAVMVDEDRISWMAINIEGTVANVQIRESKPPKAEESKKPANIVAARDGLVEKVEVFGGVAVVISGQAVRKGDLLISGVRDTKNGGFSVTRANGSVYAVTERSFRVEIPYQYEQKNYEKDKISEISLIFFGKEIKVLKNNCNNGSFCDTIDRVDMLSIPWGVSLPVGVKKVNCLPYNVTSETHTTEEAMDIAYLRLEEQIAAAIPEGMILSKKIEGEIGESSYILTCTVKCIENIAETVEFEAVLQ